jgi:hypothetical protein
VGYAGDGGVGGGIDGRWQGSGGWRGLGLGGPVGSSSTQRDLLDRLFGMDGGVIWELILLYIFFSRELNPSRQNSINPKP